MSFVVSFRNVCFSYTDQEVLHDATFNVVRNSFVGIVGPNGGGKTTLLRLMLGLEKPDQGSLRVFDSRPEQVRRRIGYVMQHMDYDERFPASVMDIVLIGRSSGKRWGFYTGADRDKAKEALDRVGMRGLAPRPFAALSGGQRQRVLIAQALAGEPGLLLLDEPTANIDAEGEATIHHLLNGLARQMTVVSVSHNVNTVLQSVTHVLCVNKTVAMSPLDQLNASVLERARGGDIAVLQHAMHCRVFDKTRYRDCGHTGAPDPPGGHR